MKYELWRDAGSDTFIPEDSTQKKFLTEGKALLWTVEAESWNEACFKKNEYLGFEPYRPMCPYCTDSITYGEDCCEANSAECTHTIGVYKSGRCRVCGFKLFESLNHRAHKLGLTRLVKNKGHRPESNW